MAGRSSPLTESDPTSFNRSGCGRGRRGSVARLIHDTLLRLDRTTGAARAPPGDRVDQLADGLTWTFKLREGVAVFRRDAVHVRGRASSAFKALYDPTVNSEIASSLLINGKPMQARALDAHTVVIQFPSAYAPGIGLLDALPILPAHKLRGRARRRHISRGVGRDDARQRHRRTRTVRDRRATSPASVWSSRAIRGSGSTMPAAANAVSRSPRVAIHAESGRRDAAAAGRRRPI